MIACLRKCIEFYAVILYSTNNLVKCNRVFTVYARHTTIYMALLAVYFSVCFYKGYKVLIYLPSIVNAHIGSC